MTEHNYIIGVDPGDTTGWVICSLEYSKPLAVRTSGETRGLIRTMTKLELLVDNCIDMGGVTVICESFILHPGEVPPAAHDAIGIIGALQWMLHNKEPGSTQLIMQVPQKRLAITDDTVKRAGYWLRGGAGHKRQALRHVLAWCVSGGHRATMEALYPR